MFKSCADCVAACVSGQQQGEDRYGATTQMNGNTSPPWLAPDQTVYQIPTQMKYGNEIIIRGAISSGDRLNIDLRNDVTRIFSMVVSEDEDIEFTPSNGVELSKTNGIFKQDFTVRFVCSGTSLSVFAGDNGDLLGNIECNQDIGLVKYLTVNAHVKELRFIFSQ